MKAVVFAYHDIGCTGLRALAQAGYQIAAIFTHTDDAAENHFLLRSHALPHSLAFRCMHQRMLITRYGLTASAVWPRTSSSRSTTAIC